MSYPKKIELEPQTHIIDMLRNVPLRGYEGELIYKDCDITFAPLWPSGILPCQRYVLKEKVDFARDQHRYILKEFGLDTFNLYTAIQLYYSDTYHPQWMLPPVVEVTKSGDSLFRILNDGMHRVYAAKELGVKIGCVVINGVDPKYPYYALPNPYGWDDVTEIEGEIPEDFIKKEYVVRKTQENPEGYKELFRDFNKVFPGIQQGRTGKSLT